MTSEEHKQTQQKEERSELTGATGFTGVAEDLPSSASVSTTDLTAELYARFFRGLGDPTRVKIVQLLLERPRTVSELVELLGSPQGRVSSHLGCLRWCGFVQGVREGRSVVYRISDPRVRLLMTAAQQLLQQNAEHVASCFIIDTREFS
jgi:ArsR family transcriptional regulator